jgi:hypothetical protein
MGSGFRTFTAGEVLTASNVQNYLMDQSVMTFGGSATRSSAIGTANFEEGMVSYLTDTDKLEVYNGTNWVSVAPTTSTPMGVLINSTSFSAVSSQSINDVFSTTYKNYLMFVRLTGSTTMTLNYRFRVSGADNSNASYQRQALTALSSTVAGGQGADQTTGRICANLATAPSIIEASFFNPFETTATSGMFKTTISSTSGSLVGLDFCTIGHDGNISFTGLTLLPSTGTITGTAYIYGLAV